MTSSHSDNVPVPENSVVVMSKVNENAGGQVPDSPEVVKHGQSTQPKAL